MSHQLHVSLLWHSLQHHVMHLFYWHNGIKTSKSEMKTDYFYICIDRYHSILKFLRKKMRASKNTGDVGKWFIQVSSSGFYPRRPAGGRRMQPTVSKLSLLLLSFMWWRSACYSKNMQVSGRHLLCHYGVWIQKDYKSVNERNKCVKCHSNLWVFFFLWTPDLSVSSAGLWSHQVSTMLSWWDETP